MLQDEVASAIPKVHTPAPALWMRWNRIISKVPTGLNIPGS